MLKNKNKKILVTGGAGYIGSNLVPALIDKGYEVRVFDKLLFGKFGLEPVLNKIELIKGDIRRLPKNILDGIWGVIHLAGLSSQADSSFYSPRYTDQVNHLAVEQLGRMAKANRVKRFVFASSCSVYLALNTETTTTSNPVSYKETDQIKIILPYALSKRAAEEALLLISDRNFKPTIFRMGTLYGFSPKMRYDLVINSFTKDAFLNKKIVVNAGGEFYRPVVDIYNVVEAYINALELPLADIGAQIFNVVGENWKLSDLARSFKKIIQKRKNTDIEIDIRPPAVTPSYKADPEKFRKIFPFNQRPLEKAIMEIWQKIESGHDTNNLRFYQDKWHNELFKNGEIEFF